MKQWLIPVTAIVALEYAAALLVGLKVGFRYSMPVTSYLMLAVVVIAISLAVFLAWRLLQALRHGDAPKNFNGFALFSAGVLLAALQMGALTWTKAMLPTVVPFWADPPLAEWDASVAAFARAIEARSQWFERAANNLAQVEGAK